MDSRTAGQPSAAPHPDAEAGRLTTWATHLAATLVGAGVRDAVVSPGSRSTPFLLAVARHRSLRVHPVIDERAAGFYALGLARTTGRPPALICTSGTAPAHYLPAVMEASEAGLPLVIVSADRPRALSHAGAPQTTDQVGLYGAHARFAVDLGDPTPGGLAGMRRLAATAVAAAFGPSPGPVHLNVRADKPLEPHPDGELDPPTVPSAVVAPRLAAADEAVVQTLADAIDRARRPALVAGPMGLEARSLRALLPALDARGVALLAECASQLRLGTDPGLLRADAYDLWIERAPEAAPDVVIEIGATPTSAAYARWVARTSARRFVLAGARPRDPSSSAEAVILGDPGATLRALLERLARAPDPDAAATLRAVESEARRAIDDATEAFGEAAVVREVARALPEGALLALGNSLPIRHANRVLRPGDADVGVISQRGVNGIDGWIAGAAGASRGADTPLALVVGDVALAHDASALALTRELERPLAIVVLDNRGGRIFERLPIAEVADEATMALFTTPPELALAPLAAAYGVDYRRAEALDAVRAALAEALARPGATLVHVPVPPHGAREVERRIAEAFAR